MRQHSQLSAWRLFGPALVGITVFLFAPFVLSIVLSLTNQRFVSPNPTEFIGVANYQRLLSVTMITLDPLPSSEEGAEPEFPRSRDVIRSRPELKGYFEWFKVDLGGRRYVALATDPVFMRSLLNNFYFSIMVVPIQCGIALGLALLVNQRFGGTRIFRTIFFAPVVTSMAVIAVVWIFLYNPDIGLINRMLQWLSFGQLGHTDWLGDTSTAMIAILIMSVWQGVGFQMVLFLAGLQGIPTVLYEAASIDGASGWDKFRHVTWPGLRNTTAFVVITTAIASFRLFTQVDVMTQGGPRDNATSTVIFHAIRVGFDGGDLGYASAISVVFFVIVVTLTFALRRALPPHT
jgi:multiple sugar transport system permease protein